GQRQLAAARFRAARARVKQIVEEPSVHRYASLSRDGGRGQGLYKILLFNTRSSSPLGPTAHALHGARCVPGAAGSGIVLKCFGSRHFPPRLRRDSCAKDCTRLKKLLWGVFTGGGNR